MQGRGISLQYIAEENNQLRLLEAELLGIQEGKEIALKDIVDTARCNHDEGVMEERKRVLEIVSERIKNIDGRFVHSIAVICELNNLKRAIQNGEKS